MSATRAFSLRSAFRAASRPVRTQITSAAGRRGYASVHNAANKSSDMPWLIGALTIGGSGSAWLIYSRPAKMDHSHEEHLEYASNEHGVGQEKPADEMNKDDEGVPRGQTTRPTSGGQTGDDESKGPMSDKKDVSIPKAVEEDMNKDSETTDKEQKSSDGEGKSGPSASAEEEGKPAEDDRSEKTSGKKEGANDTDEKAGKDDSDKQKEAKEKNQATDSKTKQAGSDGKEKPANSEGNNTEMDDDTESQGKKLSEKEPSKRVDPTSK